MFKILPLTGCSHGYPSLLATFYLVLQENVVALSDTSSASERLIPCFPDALYCVHPSRTRNVPALFSICISIVHTLQARELLSLKSSKPSTTPDGSNDS